MTMTQFIKKALELGYTEQFVHDVLDLRQREQSQGIYRQYIEYLLPGFEDKGKPHK